MVLKKKLYKKKLYKEKRAKFYKRKKIKNLILNTGFDFQILNKILKRVKFQYKKRNYLLKKEHIITKNCFKLS